MARVLQVCWLAVEYPAAKTCGVTEGLHAYVQHVCAVVVVVVVVVPI